MTSDVVFLPDCLAIPPLLIKNLFGTPKLNWAEESGLFLSTERVAVELDGVRYLLPVLQNDYLTPRLFLDSARFKEPSGSLYFRNEEQDLLFSGPEGIFKRRGSVISIKPMVWSPEHDRTETEGLVAAATVTTRKQTLIFNDLPVIIASHSRLSLILPEKWKGITEPPEKVSLELSKGIANDPFLTFDRIITENDIRVARRKNQLISLGNSPRLTPAARDLGNNLKIFR